MATSKIKVRLFSLSSYVKTALKLAEYERDDDGMILAIVPGASGFIAQGETHEEARASLEEVIEGNVLLALRLGWEIPLIGSVSI